MTTLVINAPKAKAEQEGKRSFVDTLASGVGDGYAIWRSFYSHSLVLDVGLSYCVKTLRSEPRASWLSWSQTAKPTAAFRGTTFTWRVCVRWSTSQSDSREATLELQRVSSLASIREHYTPSGELIPAIGKVLFAPKPLQDWAANGRRGQLLERPQVIVTREELQHRIWPKDTFASMAPGTRPMERTCRSQVQEGLHCAELPMAALFSIA
jgi:hypothetical protein